MPELPDLEYIVPRLDATLRGGTVLSMSIKNPIVLRCMVPGPPEKALSGCMVESVTRHGPFICFAMKNRLLICHLMLTGRFQTAREKETAAHKKIGHLCFTLFFQHRQNPKETIELSYGDDKQMGKIYILDKGQEKSIPGYATQGVDALSPEFSYEYFESRIKKARCQARVFIMDQTIISAIGNAYADEILFDAKIHPKTRCNSLKDGDFKRLYDSVRSVLAWGIKEVEKAEEPIETKVRRHMKVRNKKNEPCPVCGETIRRASVHGYDCFFCPGCQPDGGKSFVQWQR